MISKLSQLSSIRETCTRDAIVFVSPPSDPSIVRYLMVDIVVNNVMSTSLQPDYSKYFFKDPVSDLGSVLRSSLFITRL